MVEVRRMRPLLGTYVEIGVRHPRGTDAQQALAAGFDAVERVQRLMSFHDPGSDLSRLNGAGGEPVRLHAETLRVLRLARTLMSLSGGLFDPTVGGALVRHGALPDLGGPAAQDGGAAADIEITAGHARLRSPVRLTLDGIAKGWAVDRAVDALRAYGLAGGWVNAGGDLRAFGDAALVTGRREDDGSVSPLGRLRNAALATSRVCAPGRMDPARPALIVGGRTPPAQPFSVTVLARRAWRADALTKVAALAAMPQRAALVRRLGGALVEPAHMLETCA